MGISTFRSRIWARSSSIWLKRSAQRYLVTVAGRYHGMTAFQLVLGEKFSPVPPGLLDLPAIRHHRIIDTCDMAIEDQCCFNVPVGKQLCDGTPQ